MYSKFKKTVSLVDLHKSFLTIKHTYECNEDIVRNNLYNVANYSKSLGIYSSGALVEGQWVDLSSNLNEVLKKRLINNQK